MHRRAEEIALELDDVTACIFESMMAVSCDPSEAVGPVGEVGARVQFHGALEGCCVVVLALDGAVALVRAMLDMDVPPGDALSINAVAELCNMIAGGWKSGLEPAACAAEMSSPDVCMMPLNAGPVTVARRYAFEGNLIDVELRLRACPWIGGPVA